MQLVPICKRTLLSLTLLFGLCPWSNGQNTLRTQDNTGYNEFDEPGNYRDGAGNSLSWGGRDTTSHKDGKPIPIGIFQWVIDPRLGTVIPAENNDTIVHNYQNNNLTEGYTGQYNILGNLASPRLNRIFMNRERLSDHIFLDPYSFFRGSLSDFRFTNTLSPVTNLAYNKCGNNQNGEDRIRAYFASNINKISGFGFKLDYSYGRGYYNASANSLFGGTLFGYYRGEKYQMHAYINANHIKTGENGGIENDRYIMDPQSFQSSYGSKDIPTNLSDTWNRNNEQNFYLTHNYSVGITRDIEIPDSLKPQPPSETELLSQLNDSIRGILREDSIRRQLTVDSLLLAWQNSLIVPQEFLPVTSFIHTLDIQRMQHTHIAKNTPASWYTNHYYGSWNKVDDETDAMSVRNTLGIAIREGFSKWAAMGLTAYASHKLRNYTLPILLADSVGKNKWTENDISVGGELSRTQGRIIHYNANAEFWLVGENLGDFNVDGTISTDIRTGEADSMRISAHANLRHETPSFYFRHFHSQSAWWDNTDLDKQLHTRIEGQIDLSNTHTKLNVGFENIQNYTYFGMRNTLLNGKDSTSVIPADYSHDASVMQHNGSIQVFSATLSQDLHLGPVHWDNEVTYQKTSNKDVLPLPDLSVYSNLYLLFHIAKILRVQLGGDVRYWTSYYAPDYSANIGQFAVQDASLQRVKVGNYPIVNVYLNMHLKRCRIYLAMNHVNAGSGHYFWAPHYPVNPRNFHFGVSWNFFN